MSLNKIFKTVGVAAVFNVIGAVGFNKIADKYKSFVGYFAVNFAFSTLPALGMFGVDKFVNQNITSNKTIQYGLTSAECVLTLPAILSVIEQKNKFSDYCKTIFSPSFEDGAGTLKIITANSIIQSLAFKYIWDSSDETPALDPIADSDLNLDALKISTDFVSL